MAKRLILDVMKVVAGIAAVVFWLIPLATGVQVFLFVGSIVVLLICFAVSSSLDDSNTGYWPKNPTESQLYFNTTSAQQGHEPAEKAEDVSLFPRGFPSELASAAFVASNEAAWRPALAARSVEWLGTHGYGVLGTELWLPKNGSIQSLPYFQNVDRQSDEAWDSFVVRATAQTLAYLRAFTPKFLEEGDVYVNVTWVSETEFRNLKA